MAVHLADLLWPTNGFNMVSFVSSSLFFSLLCDVKLMLSLTYVDLLPCRMSNFGVDENKLFRRMDESSFFQLLLSPLTAPLQLVV
jgi:hypothetical protein